MYRILIADDEPIERIIVGKVIKRHFAEQLEIVEAVNGREAVRLFEEKKCDMAVLDIEMPGINGLSAAELIREKDNAGSIIFLTAFDEFSYARKAITVKALDYLLKPVAEEELVAVLEEAVRIASGREGRAGQTLAGKEEAAAAQTQRPEAVQDNSLENLRINVVAETMRAYVEAHYMEDITLQSMAEVMNYSEAYFCKLFKQCFDKSFVSYLTWLRMRKAKELLASPLVNVKDISSRVGYQDSNYFAKVFKRLTGKTPSEYRLHVLQNIGEQQ